MSSLLNAYLNQFLVFVFVLTRISGLVMTAPTFGGRGAPARVRAFLAIGLSIIVTPMHWGTTLPPTGNLLNLIVLLGKELIVGLSLGLAVLILFASLQLTGQIITQLSGMSLAEVFDPSFDANVAVFAQLLDLVALSVFFCIGGHRDVLAALLDTFQWMPPGGVQFQSSTVSALTELTTHSFATGLRAAAPVMVALLLAIVVTGLISRTLPQLNVMAIGFNINAVVMLLTFAVTISAAIWVFQDEVHWALHTMRDAFAP